MIELGSTSPADTAVSWMSALSEHYRRARDLHDGEELCVVFDIDGTIVDLRHLVVHVLLGYDRRRGTQQFRGLVADDITHHEDDVEGYSRRSTCRRRRERRSPSTTPRTCGTTKGFWRRAVPSRASSA